MVLGRTLMFNFPTLIRKAFKMKKRPLPVIITKKNGIFTAECLVLDITVEAKTPQEVEQNFLRAKRLFKHEKNDLGLQTVEEFLSQLQFLRK